MRAPHAGIHAGANRGIDIPLGGLRVDCTAYAPGTSADRAGLDITRLDRRRRTEGPANKNGRYRRRSFRNRYFAKNGNSSALPREVSEPNVIVFAGSYPAPSR
jgi:hypothetical protein